MPAVRPRFLLSVFRFLLFPALGLKARNMTAWGEAQSVAPGKNPENIMFSALNGRNKTSFRIVVVALRLPHGRRSEGGPGGNVRIIR